MASSSMQPVVAANKSILTPVMTLEGHKRFNYNLRNGERDLYPQVRSISYFPDGKQMISGALDMTIRRWDLREGKEIEEVRDVCEQRVDMLEVSRDGRWVVTAGGGNHTTEGGKLKVCEVETGFVRIFQSHSKPQWIQCIDISPDSTLLAAGSIDYILDGIGSSTARIWNLDTGKLVAGPFKNDHCLGSVRFSRDSKKLAVMLDIAKRLEVWDVQTQKLVVSVGNSSYSGDWTLARTPVFWTTQDKTIVAAFSFKNFKPRIDVRDDPITIYEFDASILEIVGAPFKGHTRFIANLALSFDCALLASTAYDNTAYDNTIKLWAFQSRQLLASFDVQLLDMLIYSPNSHQLAYTTLGDTKIHIYDIPLDILASIRPTRQEKPSTSASKIPDLFNFDATRRAVRRNPVIPRVISCPPRPPPTRDLQQHGFFHYLRHLLPSRTNIDQPRDFLDFPATLPLPLNISPSAQVMTQGPSHTDPRQNSRSMPPLATQPGQSLTTALFTFTARLNHLSTWWPVRASHASPLNVDVPFAWGDLRHAAAGAPSHIDDDLIRDEDYVPPPSPNPNSQPPPTGGNSTGEHGSGRLCGCF